MRTLFLTSFVNIFIEIAQVYCICVCVNVWLCNSWPVTMVLSPMENSSVVTEARIFWERKDLPQECNPSNSTWLHPIRECRCVLITRNRTCVISGNNRKWRLLWAWWPFMPVIFTSFHSMKQLGVCTFWEREMSSYVEVLYDWSVMHEQ